MYLMNLIVKKKYIIALTKEYYSTEAIKQLNIFDFLMNDNF